MPDADADGLVTPVNGLFFMGNIPKFDYDITSDVEVIKDSYSGLRQTDFRQSYSDQIDISLDLHDAGPIAMAIAHRGTWFAIQAGSVTNAVIVGLNPATNLYGPLTWAPSLYTDYFIGQRLPNGTYAPIRNLNKATVQVKDSSATPKTLVEGVNYTLEPRFGRIVFINFTTGGAYTVPVKANTSFGTVTDTLSDRIAYGVVYPLQHQRITAFQIQDSAATPVVVDPAYYVLDPVYGELQWLASQRAAFEAEEYTLPLKAVYDHGAARSLSLLSGPLDTEWWMRLRGVNTAAGNAPFLADFYRVQFSPVSGASMIHERTGKLPLKATAMADLTQRNDSILGRVGRIVQM
jgi:hypothetical protein